MQEWLASSSGTSGGSWSEAVWCWWTAPVQPRRGGCLVADAGEIHEHPGGAWQRPQDRAELYQEAWRLWERSCSIGGTGEKSFPLKSFLFCYAPDLHMEGALKWWAVSVCLSVACLDLIQECKGLLGSPILAGWKHITWVIRELFRGQKVEVTRSINAVTDNAPSTICRLGELQFSFLIFLKLACF